jgi:hypothetical protein
VLWAWLDGEDDAPLLDLDGLEPEQDADRRRRDLAGHDRAQRAEAVELGELLGCFDRVVVDGSHAASRSGSGRGFGRAGSFTGVTAASHGKSDPMVTIWPGTSWGVMALPSSGVASCNGVYRCALRHATINRGAQRAPATPLRGKKGVTGAGA